ncbi:LysR family transcriptional regulator [Sphingomonas floccifaciens]|uniref:LysR family transcriptional regulator n=2 Tax=Sphingomonas floccifaciens TaxID=1844115 RepID=A0ABW4N7P2_9SPHN
MLDPRLLRTYAAVCREGSISGAARALNISQPSVSVAIAQLEGNLACTLFERTRAGIVLTPAGAKLRRRAEMMETLVREAEAEVARASEGVRGPLTIAGTPGALVSLVPQVVERVERAGRFELNILERADHEALDLLRKGDIEIALGTTGIETAPADVEETSVLQDPFALIVGRAHDALGAEVTLAEAGRFGWVMPHAQGGFRRQIEALFLGGETPLPRDVIRSDSLLTTKAIVRRTAHVTILPHGVVAAELSIGVLRAVRLRGASFHRRIGMRTLKGRPLSDLAAEFFEGLHAVRAKHSQ